MTFSILIADNESDSRVILKEAVNGAIKDARITIAENGNEALEKAKSQDFDLVLIDLIMPFMGGVESLKVIHMSEPDLPIIVVTGADDAELKREALRSGANLLFEKPVEIQELIRAVKKLIGIQE